MSIVLITGSAGLVGSACTRLFASEGLEIVGIDNNLRQQFFGKEASTGPNRKRLEHEIKNYSHHDIDIRDTEALERIFKTLGRNVVGVIHTAGQPSHDWARDHPTTDFAVNAVSTLNLLELTRMFAPEAVFVFTSTSKVYGDTPNRLPLIEKETRWELPQNHRFYEGIDESMSVDQSMHSLFGVSKLAADLAVQEYGCYFGLKTGVFRPGCITGSWHAGAELHGFLSFLAKCAINGQCYKIYGYKGKQVRDNIHAHDLATAIWHFFQNPRVGEVYNIGGGRISNCSVLEAIEVAQELSGRPMNYKLEESNRLGDHMWWIGNNRKFQSHYPAWSHTFNVQTIMQELHETLGARFSREKS